MKERPILFNGEMVRAILAGKKTQTRRPVKPQPPDGCDRIARVMSSTDRRQRDKLHWVKVDETGFGVSASDNRYFDCPFGVPGDRLWVRETFRVPESLDKDSPSTIAAKCLEAGWTRPWAPVFYESDKANRDWTNEWGPAGKTRVAIHMPRWACRLFLDVTEVRVQRVEDITEADAKAEGFESREAFLASWYRIYPVPNPWVWAVSFKMVQP